jgi:hypothetical protein
MEFHRKPTGKSPPKRRGGRYEGKTKGNGPALKRSSKDERSFPRMNARASTQSKERAGETPAVQDNRGCG